MSQYEFNELLKTHTSQPMGPLLGGVGFKQTVARILLQQRGGAVFRNECVIEIE